MLKVKIFDENHEKDLEKSINTFIQDNEIEVINIQFQTAISIFGGEQVYCFSGMILYKEKKLHK